MKKFEEFENMYERLLENIFEEKDSAANIYKIVHERKQKKYFSAYYIYKSGDLPPIQENDEKKRVLFHQHTS